MLSFRLTRFDTSDVYFRAAVNCRELDPALPHSVVGRAAHRACMIFTAVVADGLVEGHENFCHSCTVLRCAKVQQRCRARELKGGRGATHQRPPEAAGASGRTTEG